MELCVGHYSLVYRELIRHRSAPFNMLRVLKASSVFPWVIAFVLLSVSVPQSAATNAASRLLTLRAISEEGTLRINPDLTFDWAQAPDGSYYSNKAPGPILLGLPVYLVVDGFWKILDQNKLDDEGLRPKPRWKQNLLMSLLMQIFPLILLLVLFANWFRENGYSVASTHFFTLAVCFGSTTSLFYNSYFGHAFVANVLLAMLLAWLYGRYLLVGFLFGIGVCSEYSVAVLLPGLLLLTLLVSNEKRPAILANLVMGGAALFAVFIGYNWLLFGGPFEIPNLYQNPTFNLPGHDSGTGSLLTFELSAAKLFELTFGMSRGMFTTQPWLLLIVAYCFLPRTWRDQQLAGICLFSLLGLTFLVLLISTFGGWHGGNSAGPRYLCYLFPLFAFIGATTFDRLSVAERWLLACLLIVAIALRSLVYTSNILAPLENLWTYYWAELLEPEQMINRVPRLILFWLALSIAAFFVSKKQSIFKPEPRRS